jgi:hypothetical protein
MLPGSFCLFQGQANLICGEINNRDAVNLQSLWI